MILHLIQKSILYNMSSIVEENIYKLEKLAPTNMMRSQAVNDPFIAF
jgi:hypothetical protein